MNIKIFLLFLVLVCSGFKFRESALAHALLDGKRGLEIGGSAHNPFGLRTLNVDFEDNPNSPYKREEVKLCGRCLPVDIIASGDDLPFKDERIDFVISSHVLEHFFDPIKAIEEWLRVVKPGGYVYMIVPHKERTFDKNRPRTTLAQLLERHYHPENIDPREIEAVPREFHDHFSVWITEDILELCHHFGWPVVAVQDVDDKAGNGFTVVVQKPM